MFRQGESRRQVIQEFFRAVRAYLVEQRRRPPGFDLGNSPAALRPLSFAGTPFIQRTSAGTQGVVRVFSPLPSRDREAPFREGAEGLGRKLQDSNLC